MLWDKVKKFPQLCAAHVYLALRPRDMTHLPFTLPAVPTNIMQQKFRPIVFYLDNFGRGSQSQIWSGPFDLDQNERYFKN